MIPMGFDEILDAKVFSPAALFYLMWSYVKEWTGFQRTTADPCIDIQDDFRSALNKDGALAVVEEIKRILSSESGSVRQRKGGAILSAMRMLDESFLYIHPRTAVDFDKGHSNKCSDWLRQAELERVRSGSYFESETERLIARGPLVRSSRRQFSAGGELPEDYFSALSIVPKVYKLGARDIAIKHIVVPVGGLAGLMPENIGSETITFAPIACVASDLQLTVTEVGEQGFVEVECLVEAEKTFQKIIDSVGRVDVLIAPELTLSESSVREVATHIRRNVSGAPRITIAGSGNSNDVNEDELKWNQTEVINEFGTSLWVQRKMWTSGFTNERAIEYGLHPSKSGFLLEKNAEVNELTIADIDGFGRACILICQDLQAAPLTAELIRNYQPDWVFSPILDRGVQSGRWAHQRVFDLSGLSSSRFIVASSLALVPSTAFPWPPIGLAVGPKAITEDGLDDARVYIEAVVDKEITPISCTIKWRDKSWSQTVLDVKKKIL